MRVLLAVVIVWDFKYGDLGDPTIFSNVLYERYRVFTRSKERLERDADPSPHSNAVVYKK